MCGSESAIFLIVKTTKFNNDISKMVQVLTAKLMLITAQSFATTQHLHNYKFTLVDKAVLSSARLLCVAQDAIFYTAKS